MAVGVRHIGPDHPINARQASQRFAAQARQLAEEAGRQSLADGQCLRIDDRGVVEQPLRGRPRMAAVGGQLLQHLARLVQIGNVLAQARKEGLAAQPVRRVRIMDGSQVLAVQAKACRAEQLGPDRCLNRGTEPGQSIQNGA